ncbi:MATE family efflux transporter [Paraburkholderia strydomiana]|uniref:MATE family efflux transporter n=1 Tax=Paraburkholderia strydomiana TaxID=1245417 RepID=UPI0028563CB5|nr:MATE family efflux transporter [Paraburkholderia strydomiana]MDR7010042.1 MATE family multidrug resistance protein [Paraburkholderia strydomiana]
MRHYREIVQLATPIAGIQLAQVALTSTDLLMMGLINVEAVAAGGLAILLYNQIRTMCVGMVTSVGNLVAASVARSEKRTGSPIPDAISAEEVKDLLRASLLLGMIVSLCAGTILLIAGQLLAFAGQDVGVTSLAKPILATLAPGLLPMLWLNVLRQFSVGMRRAGSLLTVTIVSIGVNALLDAAFVYGWLGIPRMGLAGIGLATTSVQGWTFIVYLRMIRRDRVLRPLLALDGWNAPWSTVVLIARTGTPIALTYGSEAAITSIATVFMGTFGPVALAASNIVNQLAYLAYQLNIGLSQGSSILVSRAMSKGEHSEIAAIARQTLAISASLMFLLGLLYIFVPQVVLRPFLGMHADPSVTAAASILLWFAIAHQLLKGSQNICIGLLRGLGNTKTGLISALVGYWLVGIPAMALLAFGAGRKGPGVWSGLCVGFGVTSILLWQRFRRDLSAARRRKDEPTYHHQLIKREAGSADAHAHQKIPS